MPFHRRAQDRTVATFLETSRIHFDLNPPRSHAGNHRWFAVPRMRSLLIAGSLGALFGGPALANTAIDTVRDLELRPGQSVAARPGEAGDFMQAIRNKQ